MRFYAIWLAAAAANAAVTSGASAAGALDGLDPCIKATSQFHEAEREFAERVRVADRSIDTQPVPATFRAAWLDASKKALRTSMEPSLRKAGMSDAQIDVAVNALFEEQIKKMKPGELDGYVADTFRKLAKEEIARERTEGESKFAEARSDLDGGCKPDVASQILRVSLAPIGWVDGNFKAAKEERNGLAAILRAITGVSPRDIGKYGLLGGENSELRKFVNNNIAGGENSEARQTLRFLDPGNTDGGILGGPNSVFRKPFG